MTDKPDTPDPEDRPLIWTFDQAKEWAATDVPFQTLTRLRQERDETRRALAGTASLPEPQRTQERDRLRPEIDRIEVELLTLRAVERIEALTGTAITSADARAVQSAQREEAMADMTDTLLTLTIWLVGLAALTVLAAIITLIVAIAK